MSDKEFKILNKEYIECLNNLYDQFFEGKDVEINNDSCNEIKEKMKKFGFYKELDKEFLDYKKNEEKNIEKNKG
jgi:hypothetical protein